MKSKKLLVLFTAFTLLITPSITTNTVHAQEKSKKLEVKLDNIAVLTDYDVNNVIVETDNTNLTDGVSKVIVKDKSTKKILEVFSEKPSNDGISTYATTYNTFVTRERYDGPVVTTLELQLNIWNEGSFRQINSVLSAKIFASSSGQTTLEDGNATWYTPENQLPAIQVDFSGSGVITGTASKSQGTSFDFKVLESAGFSVSNQSSTTWYYRKYVQIRGTYKVM